MRNARARERISDYLRLRRDEAAKIEKKNERATERDNGADNVRIRQRRNMRGGGGGHRKIHDVTPSGDDDRRWTRTNGTDGRERTRTDGRAEWAYERPGRNGGDETQLLVRQSHPRRAPGLASKKL